MKTGNEEAITALRHSGQAWHPLRGSGTDAGAVRAREQRSGRSREQGRRGVAEVLLLALEGRVNGRSLCSHPVCAWLVEHVGDVMTKYMTAKDGAHPMSEYTGSATTRSPSRLASNCSGYRPAPHAATS